MYQIVQMYLEQDHLVQNEYFMIGRQKVVIVVFLVYIIVPNVNNILKKIHVSRYCFFFLSTAARDETCVQSTLSRHWPFVLWVDWINTQFSPMADGQSGGHRVEGRNWEEESLLI